MISYQGGICSATETRKNIENLNVAFISVIYALLNHNGADQTARMCSLIGTFLFAFTKSFSQDAVQGNKEDKKKKKKTNRKE